VPVANPPRVPTSRGADGGHQCRPVHDWARCPADVDISGKTSTAGPALTNRCPTPGAVAEGSDARLVAAPNPFVPTEDSSAVTEVGVATGDLSIVTSGSGCAFERPDTMAVAG
jgi:hypothetical protein